MQKLKQQTFRFFLKKTRAVGRHLCLGAVPDPKRFSELCRSKKTLFWLLGGSGRMLLWKMFKMKGLRLTKNAFLLHFSSEKLDQNKSAHTLALKFGLSKKLSDGFHGELYLTQLVFDAIL